MLRTFQDSHTDMDCLGKEAVPLPFVAYSDPSGLSGIADASVGTNA